MYVCVNNSWCGGYGVCVSANAGVEIVMCVSVSAGVEIAVCMCQQMLLWRL